MNVFLPALCDLLANYQTQGSFFTLTMTDIFFIIFSGKSFVVFFVCLFPSLKCVFYVSWYFVQ